ncbi:MAG: acetyl-CoA carboxylase carboxyltransferase subunit beta [Lentisphaerae bacterium]|nr:acetyl-CoA carboxylase carboxyltransferase subunit beta [Lentisphaerota bacterium]
MPLFGSRKKYISLRVPKKELPEGLWTKCPACKEIVFKREIEAANGICPKCAYHFQINWKKRLALLVDEGTFEEWDADMVSRDPLDFTGQSSYISKLDESRKKSGLKEAVVCGTGAIERIPTAVAIMDFAFMGGSMGSVVGEKVTRAIEKGTELTLPVVVVSASGGARMYEGMLSLMQMAKTSAALARHARAGLAYISVLTHPTTAGVMASFASLGDVIIAEPGALIGFAGPRVIRETTREEVPEGFQRSEFVLKHGLVDMIVHRKELKSTIARLLAYMSNSASAPAQNNLL